MSKYYAMLNGGMQSKIIKRLGIDNKKILSKWLQCLNLLRNRCAHHSRVWNRKHSVVQSPQNDFFDTLQINESGKERLYSAICIIWYLVRMIGPSSQWIRQVAEHFDTKPHMPGCSFVSIGMPQTGFPRARFGGALGFVSADNDPVHQHLEDGEKKPVSTNYCRKGAGAVIIMLGSNDALYATAVGHRTGVSI